MMHESNLYSKSFTFTRRFEAFRISTWDSFLPICWKPSWVDIDLLQVCTLRMLPLQHLSSDWKPWYTIVVPSCHIIPRLTVSCRLASTTYISFLRNAALAILGHASRRSCPTVVVYNAHPVIACFVFFFFCFVLFFSVLFCFKALPPPQFVR
ncbi:hypothetical protein BDV11DRAFT_42890 [Aspergillus similis]